MRILLTGSSGLVGSVLAGLLAADNTVIGLDRVPGRHTTHLGDIIDPRLVADLASRVEAVIHTASLHAPHVGTHSEQAFVSTNVHGTETLLDACMRHGVRRFVYTSTTSLYGHAMEPGDRAVWVTEELPPIPRDIYDTTKIAAEDLCRAAAGAALTCVSLRISRCFQESPERVAIYRLYRGVDPRDAAEAHRLALAAPLAGFHVYNVSAASPFSREETGELLADAARVITRHYPWAAGEFRARGWRLPRTIDRVYSIANAQESLGYQPRYNFEALLPGKAHS